ncbi:MAG: DnaA ATPase domain-containing protein [Planctomycetota bacterium]
MSTASATLQTNAAPAARRSNADIPTESSIERRLAARIGAARYRMWFAEPARLRIDGRCLEVMAPSRFAADWIERNFRDDLASVAADVGLESVAVTVLDAPGLVAPDAAASPTQREVALVPAARRDQPRWRRLADVVVGESNRIAYESARRLAEDELGGIRGILLHGGCGVGKTHLLQGLCARRRELHPQERIRYTTGEQFTNDYIQAVRGGTIEAFRAKVRKLELLAIDDVHFLSNKGATQAEFLHTIDAIGLGGARIAIVTDAHPRALRSFSEALVSRMLAGMVVQVEAPDRGTREALVTRIAEERGIALEPAAARMIGDRAIGSVREIEGALARIAAALLLEDLGGIATLSLVERALGLGDAAVRGAPPRIAAIVEATCDELGVSRDDLAASGRHRRVVLARGVVVHLAREMTTLSFPEIARHLGRNAHSSAHAAAKRVRDMLDRGEELPPDDRAPASRSVRELVETVKRGVERRTRASR